MTRDYGVVIQDMMAAIEGIEQTIGDADYGTFCADWTRRHAVQRGIEIVSEASRHLPDALLASHPEIPWSKIRAIGNVLRHEYHAIADEVVWNITRHSLPQLKQTLLRMHKAQ